MRDEFYLSIYEIKGSSGVIPSFFSSSPRGSAVLVRVSRTQLGSHQLINQEHTSSVRYNPEQMSGQTAIQRPHAFLHPNELERLQQPLVLDGTIRKGRLTKTCSNDFMRIRDKGCDGLGAARGAHDVRNVGEERLGFKTGRGGGV